MTTRSEELDALRKRLNQQQTELRRVMTKSGQHAAAVGLFLQQHATLHSATMAPSRDHTLVDRILHEMSADQLRQIPPKREHSIAWCLWHIARIEDTAMNILVAGAPEVLVREGWLRKLNVDRRDSANAMTSSEITAFSGRVDIDALHAYRHSVGRSTRAIVTALQADELKQKVEPERINKVLEVGAVAQAASGIAAYWGRRTIAGLLLMPATRHSLVHLNEMIQISHRL